MKIEAALTAIKEKFEISGKSKIFEVKTGLLTEALRAFRSFYTKKTAKRILTTARK